MGGAELQDNQLEAFYNIIRRSFVSCLSVMGQNAAKFSQTIKAVREDDQEVKSIEFNGSPLTDKDVRKLVDALRTNR